jgi:hypothetical protein
LKIIDVRSGNRVVTALELLSDSNKQPGDGRDQYRKKQREYVQGGVNLVEIDLLRSGQRVFAVPVSRIPPSYRTTYQACVTRSRNPRSYEVYRAALQAPLPTIRVPLRETDPDVPLNLQALIEQCYHNGRYDDSDYRIEPSPPLDSQDAAWATELLASQGFK